MENPKENALPRIYAENIIIGDTSSRLSSIIVVLVCGLSIFTTILFGAVDNAAWIFITVFWVSIILLWLADAWKVHGLLVNSDSIQLPLIGLLLI